MRVIALAAPLAVAAGVLAAPSAAAEPFLPPTPPVVPLPHIAAAQLAPAAPAPAGPVGNAENQFSDFLQGVSQTLQNITGNPPIQLVPPPDPFNVPSEPVIIRGIQQDLKQDLPELPNQQQLPNGLQGPLNDIRGLLGIPKPGQPGSIANPGTGWTLSTTPSAPGQPPPNCYNWTGGGSPVGSPPNGGIICA